MLIQERLKELLHYDPSTGLFTRLVRCSNQKAGKVAGYLHRGYVEIRVDGATYQASNLAWLYMTGELPDWPRVEIDHENGVKRDNRFKNLRLISHKINSQNQRKPHARTSSGLLGVSRAHYAHGDVFHARIRIGKKLLYLGTHKTAEAAHTAYVEAKRRFHPGNTL